MVSCLSKENKQLHLKHLLLCRLDAVMFCVAQCDITGFIFAYWRVCKNTKHLSSGTQITNFTTFEMVAGVKGVFHLPRKSAVDNVPSVSWKAKMDTSGVLVSFVSPYSLWTAHYVIFCAWKHKSNMYTGRHCTMLSVQRFNDAKKTGQAANKGCPTWNSDLSGKDRGCSRMPKCFIVAWLHYFYIFYVFTWVIPPWLMENCRRETVRLAYTLSLVFHPRHRSVVATLTALLIDHRDQQSRGSSSNSAWLSDRWLVNEKHTAEWLKGTAGADSCIVSF